MSRIFLEMRYDIIFRVSKQLHKEIDNEKCHPGKNDVDNTFNHMPKLQCMFNLRQCLFNFYVMYKNTFVDLDVK